MSRSSLTEQGDITKNCISTDYLITDALPSPILSRAKQKIENVFCSETAMESFQIVRIVSGRFIIIQCRSYMMGLKIVTLTIEIFFEKF